MIKTNFSMVTEVLEEEEKKCKSTRKSYGTRV